VLDILDAAALLRWREWSLVALSAVRGELNALNIFPVADADTGTNLYLTLASPILAAAPPDTLAEAANAIAAAALEGAHGSSGAILSQLLRGVADVFAATQEPVSGRLVAQALTQAAESAYVAVSRPVEGTMLSVARAAARAAVEKDSDILGDVVVAAVGAAREALLRTPEQLDILALAGVVDAGARGVVVLLEVMQAVVEDGAMPVFVSRPRARRSPRPSEPASASEVVYLLRADDAAVPALRSALDLLGDAVVLSGAAGLWNVHVHTETPDDAIAAGRAVGTLDRIVVKPLDQVVLSPYFADSTRIPVITALGDTIAVAVANLIADAGGQLAFSPGEPGPSRRREIANYHPATGIVIAVGADVARWHRQSAPEMSVVEVESVVQVFAALAVHDPMHQQSDDVAGMAAAARATNYAESTRHDAAKTLRSLLTDEAEIVTVIAGSRATAHDLTSTLHSDRPALSVDILVASDLGDTVLIGVE
jgi:uncharacterized protein